MPFKSKRDFVFLALACFFVANAVVAELIGGKLIVVFGFTLSIGIIPWPIVFLTTDLINEFYGKTGVRRLSYLTTILIIYAFIILFFASVVKAADFSPVTDEQFTAVFGQSMWIIVGSVIAFLVSQLIDVFVFWKVHQHTQGKYIGLRATVSTAVSQLIDSFIVLGIAFWLPGKINFAQFINLGFTNYVIKLAIALLLIPFIYAGHNLIKKII
ncbi:MAG: queuosine precursor transporter [Bacteroidia bacterium]|nr:queuosine precursor transporter [Bacteroidia bacterium]